MPRQRTWKNHFIATLATCDPSFPLEAWEYLVPHAECTLNLLRPSATSPKLSAWEYVCGKYDFNASPLAPPGTKAVILDPPERRDSWAKHGTEAFYVGPAFHHYRCYTFYVPTTTRSIRISDSVSWFPLPKFMSTPSSHTLAQFAIDDLFCALKLLSTGNEKDITAAIAITQKMSAILLSTASSLDPTSSSAIQMHEPITLPSDPFVQDDIAFLDSVLPLQTPNPLKQPLVDKDVANLPRVVPHIYIRYCRYLLHCDHHFHA